MGKIDWKVEKIVWIIKALFLAYLTSGILLLLMALAVYKLEWGEQIVSAGVIVVYVFSNLAAGIYSGKKFGHRRFLAGLVCGVLYAILLCLVSAIVYRDISGNVGNMAVTLLVCSGSGMVGGMIS